MKLLPSRRTSCIHHSTTHEFTVSLHAEPHTYRFRATAASRRWNGYRNKSQHRKLTTEKEILPPFPRGLEPATFRSRFQRSTTELSPLTITTAVVSIAPYLTNKCDHTTLYKIKKNVRKNNILGRKMVLKTNSFLLVVFPHGVMMSVFLPGCHAAGTSPQMLCYLLCCRYFPSPGCYAVGPPPPRVLCCWYSPLPPPPPRVLCCLCPPPGVMPLVSPPHPGVVLSVFPPHHPPQGCYAVSISPRVLCCWYTPPPPHQCYAVGIPPPPQPVLCCWYPPPPHLPGCYAVRYLPWVLCA